MCKLVRASKSVHTIDDLTILNWTSYDHQPNYFNTFDYLSGTSLRSNELSKLPLISDIEQFYAVSSTSKTFIGQLDTESSSLNKTGTYDIALSITNLNTQDALRNAKQDRWLVRNSLLSENLVINSNAFTQSKKLLGVNFLNSEAASSNV
jgi:hypothetical protein